MQNNSIFPGSRLSFAQPMMAKALVTPPIRIYQIRSSSQDHPPPKSLYFCGVKGTVVSFFQSHMLWTEGLSAMGAEDWSTSPSSYREKRPETVTGKVPNQVSTEENSFS